MTDDSTARAGIRWKVERVADGRIDLVIFPGQALLCSDQARMPNEEEIRVFRERLAEAMADGFQARIMAYQEAVLRFPMGDAEAYSLMRGIDRVQAHAAQGAEGIFSVPVPSASEVRRQMSVRGYIVISPDIEAHTKMVQATPWANWVEEVPAPPGSHGVAWFVDVFAGDDGQFGELALIHGVTRMPSAYTGTGEQGSGGG